MKRDKMFMLIGIFLVAIILSTIHQGYREGMSHHDKVQELKGEKHGESLIEKDIKVVIVLAWNFFDYIADKNRSLIEKGFRFISIKELEDPSFSF